jgi:hypothetical protein
MKYESGSEDDGRMGRLIRKALSSYLRYGRSVANRFRDQLASSSAIYHGTFCLYTTVFGGMVIPDHVRA